LYFTQDEEKKRKDSPSPTKRVKLGESLPIEEIDVAQLQGAGRLDIDRWSVALLQSIPVIGDYETDFPESLYVRQEMLDIFHLFTERIACQKGLIFVGTPGVGKSVNFVLFSFYMAIKLNMRVQLLQRTADGYSLLNLDGSQDRYWEQTGVLKDLMFDFEFTLCLDGFHKKHIDENIFLLVSPCLQHLLSIQ
jgi:hypothetical protein